MGKEKLLALQLLGPRVGQTYVPPQTRVRGEVLLVLNYARGEEVYVLLKSTQSHFLMRVTGGEWHLVMLRETGLLCLEYLKNCS